MKCGRRVDLIGEEKRDATSRTCRGVDVRHASKTRAQRAKIPLLTFGLSLSSFTSISYVVCIAGYLLFPGLPISHGVLKALLPGFTFLSWSGFFLGLAESFAWGWYCALTFGLLFNFFSARGKA